MHRVIRWLQDFDFKQWGAAEPITWQSDGTDPIKPVEGGYALIQTFKKDEQTKVFAWPHGDEFTLRMDDGHVITAAKEGTDFEFVE